MIIGIPRESLPNEHRVGLNPFAVSRLVRRDHAVAVQSGAGDEAHFSDQHYQSAGGRTVYSADEVHQRADLICRVAALSSEELEQLKPGAVICGFHHLAVAPREHVERMMSLGCTLIGYEIIRDARGELPVLQPFSEMAGQMSVQIAAHYLQTEAGGRGVLIGNVPGVPPPTVVILGAGAVGCSAARQARASGAHVIVLDNDMRKMSLLNRRVSGQVVTVAASTARLERYTAIADVLIGAILIPGERAPFLVTEAMVEEMKPGSVIIDVSIDQGGCIETSRPTSLDNPTYVCHDVVHYCVPNMTSGVARTASRALVNAALPYILEIADQGLERALRDDRGLAEGLYLYRGRLVNQQVGRSLDIPATTWRDLVDKGDLS